MRVVAGTAGGIPLQCPKTGTVRPTMDQVRGAIFSSLAESVPGSSVVDLFAGTGGLGIEALSRGATKAVFVERDRRTIECLRSNLERTRLNELGRVEVVCLDVFTFLYRRVQLLSEADRGDYDLIFADPPYTTLDQTDDFSARLIKDEALPRLLKIGGLFVLEKSPLHTLPMIEECGWTLIRQKRYGTTEVSFLMRTDDVRDVALHSPSDSTDHLVLWYSGSIDCCFQ